MNSNSEPLTRRQTLMWLDHQLYPAAPYHNVSTTVRLRGEVDLPRLQDAYRATVGAIDYLRLVVDPAEPLQWIDASPGAPLEHVDLSNAPGSYAEWFRRHATARFEFGGPLLRSALVTLGAGEHVLHVCNHHIIADGISALSMLEYLSSAYAGLPPARPTSFLPFVAYERAYRESQDHQRDAAYWNAKLSRGVPPLSFYGRSHTSRSIAVRRLRAPADSDRVRALDALSQTRALQLMTAEASRLAAFATLLVAYAYRATGNREIVLATPSANRPSAFAATCGLLMEQVFLKLDIAEGETFASLANAVRKEILGSFRRGRYCVSDRGLSFVSLNLLTREFDLFPGLRAEVEFQEAYTLVPPSGPGDGDLRNTLGLNVHRLARGAGQLAFDFHADTFGGGLDERALGHFERLCDALLTDVHTPLDRVSLLGEEERRRLVFQSRGAERDAAPDFLQKLSEHAASQPDATAVVSGARSWSYSALERQSNRLARRLIDLGAGGEALVAVALPRGADELLALLAVLKAGSAYVPLDSTHPKDRIRLILEDAKPRIAIAGADSAVLFHGLPGCTTIHLEQEWPAIAAMDDAPAYRGYAGDPLAYVLFTSGSTGRPKGVEVCRHSVDNFLRSMAAVPGLSAKDRLLAITTTTFDISGLELYLPLYVGGTVEIADKDTALDPELLRRVLERPADRVTTLQATPATWRLLVEAGWQGDGKLRILCGGEALSRELADKLLSRGGELWNLYGPTETTIWSTAKRITLEERGITIGRPIDRTQVYVLDDACQVVPQGVVGELCIGGAGLARGYHGRPDLTAERFVPGPPEAGAARIYRTGDLARQLENGEIECLGRVDHQLKIRGFRIEAAEIESVLRRTAGVTEAVVVKKERGGEPMLVAYWSGPAAEAGPLAECARGALPHYMQPQAYVHVEKFPLNTNGKIDRKNLPEPDARTLPSGKAGLAPRNDLEARMAALWRKLLGLDAVGVDEDFFVLGGSSPLAIELAARVRKEFHVGLALRAIFETPTIAALVGRLGAPAVEGPIVLPLRESAGSSPIFCLHGIQLYQDLADALAPGQSLVAMHEPVRRRNLPTMSVEAIAAKYVELIRGHQAHGPYKLAGLCFAGALAFEAARQLEAAGETVSAIVLFDATLPRAMSADRVGMIRELARRSVSAPGAMAGRLLAKVRERFFPRAPANAIDDLPVLGREAGLLIQAYESRVQPVAADVIVVRALREDFPPWVRRARNLGWDGLAHKLTVCELDCSHMETVHSPHVGSVAALLRDWPEA